MDEAYLREFLRNLKLTRNWLRKQYGDRLLDAKGFDDWAQEAALAILRREADPRFMQRKAKLQQKTFFVKKHYRRPRSTQVSELESGNPDTDLYASLFVEDKRDTFVTPTEKDWDDLRKRFGLRQVDIEMLQMRMRGIPVDQIAAHAKITTSSVHVRISDIKIRVMAVRKMEERQ